MSVLEDLRLLSEAILLANSEAACRAVSRVSLSPAAHTLGRPGSALVLQSVVKGRAVSLPLNLVNYAWRAYRLVSTSHTITLLT